MTNQTEVLRDVIRERLEEKYNYKFVRLRTVPVMARICLYLIRNGDKDHAITSLMDDLGLSYMGARYYLRLLLQIEMIKIYRVINRANMYQMVNWKATTV